MVDPERAKQTRESLVVVVQDQVIHASRADSGMTVCLENVYRERRTPIQDATWCSECRQAYYNRTLVVGG